MLEPVRCNACALGSRRASARAAPRGLPASWTAVTPGGPLPDHGRLLAWSDPRCSSTEGRNGSQHDRPQKRSRRCPACQPTHPGRESMSQPTLLRPGSSSLDYRRHTSAVSRCYAAVAMATRSIVEDAWSDRRPGSPRAAAVILAGTCRAAPESDQRFDSASAQWCANSRVTCDQSLCTRGRLCPTAVIASVVHQLNRRPRRCANTPGSGTRSINSAC